MNKRIVNFIVWSMYDPAGSQNNLQISKKIDKNQSLRDVAIEILKTQKSIPVTGIGMEDAINFDELTLIIKPMPKAVDISNFRDESEFLFGPRYFIQHDGGIRLLRGFEPMRAWTLSELDDLSNHGYIDYKKNNIIVVVPAGLGATAELSSLVEMIGTISSIIGLGRAVVYAPGFVKSIFNCFADKKTKSLAKQWKKQGIRYPYELREFIDLKVVWTLKEVRTRLKINEEYAIRLLVALGFEPVGDIWRLTQSQKSINARKRWMANERYWSKKRGIVNN